MQDLDETLHIESSEYDDSVFSSKKSDKITSKSKTTNAETEEYTNGSGLHDTEDDISSLPTDALSSSIKNKYGNYTDPSEYSRTTGVNYTTVSKTTSATKSTQNRKFSSSKISSKFSSKRSSRKTKLSYRKNSVQSDQTVKIEPIDPDLAKEILQPRPDLVFGLPRDKTGDAIIDAAISGAQTKSKVSSRIQQLLQTLSKPRKKPLVDFYRDLNQKEKIDGVPKPRGPLRRIISGKDISARDDDLLELLINNVESYPREPAFTSWDVNGKPKTWTWVKFHARAKAAAYEITEKFGLEPGDKCGLMIPNSEPFTFLAAFFGCLLAEVIPLSVELPITNSRDGLTARFGFLLRSCQIQVNFGNKIY